MLKVRTPFVFVCIAVVAFAPLLAPGVGDFCILVPLWLGGPDGRVALVRREPLVAAEQPLSLFSVRSSRAPPTPLAVA